MKLNVWKNQREIEKTFECDEYDLMYGTMEDILELFDSVEDSSTNDEILKVINSNRLKLNSLLMDVFPDMTKEDIRNIKVKELIPFFMDLFGFVKESLTGTGSKNQ